MPDILHRVGLRASSPAAAYAALATIEGLAGWWTSDTRGDSVVGGQIRFTFGDKGFFVMRVLVLAPARQVRWQVVDGPEEWVGTTITFDIVPEGDYAIVLFKQQGWREPVEFMHHCSTKWAMFLLSLKALVETGTGTPFPDDIKIDNWN